MPSELRLRVSPCWAVLAAARLFAPDLVRADRFRVKTDARHGPMHDGRFTGRRASARVGAWPGGLRLPKVSEGGRSPVIPPAVGGAVWLRRGLDELPGTSTFTSVAVVAGGHPVLVAGGVVAARV